MGQSYSLRIAIVSALVTAVGACANGWSMASVSPQPAAAGWPPTSVQQIHIIEGDVADRPYTSLGDISVTVNKVTILNADPTRDMVDQRLRAEAAKLGADAVILVRYGSVGIAPFTWGSLDGRGRAVAFARQ